MGRGNYLAPTPTGCQRGVAEIQIYSLALYTQAITEPFGNDFIEKGNRRFEVMWEGAIQELCDLGLLQDRGYQGEVFSITSEGYRVADLIRESR